MWGAQTVAAVALSAAVLRRRAAPRAIRHPRRAVGRPVATRHPRRLRGGAVVPLLGDPVAEVVAVADNQDENIQV